jgi:hypothetical protein
MATQREIWARVRGSISRVAPKKMKAPESGLTMENNAPNASRKVVNLAPFGSPWRASAGHSSESEDACDRHGAVRVLI